MYYTIFEGMPFEGKEKLGEQYYKSLLPHLHGKFKGNGFHEDAFSGSPYIRKGVNVAVWDNAEAAWQWRNEENHMRVQKKGSEGVYESYRLRLGSEIAGSKDPEPDKIRQYLTLFYREKSEEKPQDDVTALLEPSLASRLREEVNDSIVYQGEQTLWITGWRSGEAVGLFEESVNFSPGDRLVKVRIERDYTKSNRVDAPHETPGMR